MIRSINIALGIVLIIISIVFIIPMTAIIIKSKGGGFGFGLMFLPILVPLCFSLIFGVIGMLNYLKNYSLVRASVIGAHIITALAGVLSFALMPLFPFLVISIPIAIWLLQTMTKENIGKQLLITNSLFLLCLLAFLYFCFNASDKTFVEQIIQLWM